MERNIYNSIDRLTKIVLYKFENYDPEIAIETYMDLIEFYNRFTDENFKDYIKDKLQWINQHPKTDQYYLPRLLSSFEKNIK